MGVLKRETVSLGEGLDVVQPTRHDLYVANCEVEIVAHISNDFEVSEPRVRMVHIFSDEEGVEFVNHQEWVEFVKAVSALDASLRGTAWEKTGPGDSVTPT